MFFLFFFYLLCSFLLKILSLYFFSIMASFSVPFLFRLFSSLTFYFFSFSFFFLFIFLLCLFTISSTFSLKFPLTLCHDIFRFESNRYHQYTVGEMASIQGSCFLLFFTYGVYFFSSFFCCHRFVRLSLLYCRFRKL